MDDRSALTSTPEPAMRLATFLSSAGRRGFPSVRILLGLLLLAAAGLKLYGSKVTEVPLVGWLSAPRVQVAAAVWEIVLGLWLLSATYQAGAWLAAIVTFFAFAGVSGYLGQAGVVTCGCLGVVRASPWLAFGVDVTALVLLAVCRPALRTGSFRLPPRVVGIAASAGAMLLVLTGFGIWTYGSPQAVLARLQGRTLTISSDYIDFGSGTVDQVLTADVEVWNVSDRPVRLTGGTTDCTCVTTSGLPKTIPPGESWPVPVKLTIPSAGSGRFTRVVELWTDRVGEQTIRVRVGCRVVE